MQMALFLVVLPLTNHLWSRIFSYTLFLAKEVIVPDWQLSPVRGFALQGSTFPTTYFSCKKI